ncbi:hypothetical protein ACTMU2_29090 [Cupriavidus basilensis]
MSETTRCGRIAKRGLAQSRKRFLMVARHVEKVPAFLYEPDRIVCRASVPCSAAYLCRAHVEAGPMHRVPSLQWKTWVLAFVGDGDWRSLHKLAVQDGYRAIT